MLSSAWKCTLIVAILVLSFGTIGVFAQEPILGRVRIASFVCPRQVAPDSVFSVTLVMEYEIRTTAIVRATIFGTLAKASTPLWQSDVANVSMGGDKVWTVNFTAPPTEGTIQLTAYAYYFENDTWQYYNDTVLGPGFKQVVIKVARNAALQVELGVPALQLTLGNLSSTTTSAGDVDVSLPVGMKYVLSVPGIVQYQNSTRIMFNGWQDDNNQSSRTVSLDGDTQLVGSYRTQYLLRVTSTVANYSYEKWYDAGSTVTLQRLDSVPMVWPLGLLGGDYNFSGWSGDVTSRSGEVTFTMNSPKNVSANFSINYGALIVFPIIIAVGVIGEATLLVLKRKKTAHVQDEPTISVSTCPNCGESIEEGWQNCIHCGGKLGSIEHGQANS